MSLPLIRFKSGLTDPEILKIVENKKSEFLKVPGLLQKYYVRDKQTLELAGVYL